MLVNVAIHNFFTFDEEDERCYDPEYTNLWVEDVELPIDDMRTMTESEIVWIIFGVIMTSGNWTLPFDSYDFGISLNYREDMHSIINKAFADTHTFLQEIYCFDKFYQRVVHSIWVDGWHIVRDLGGDKWEWIGQGSSFCEDKLIN